MDIVLLGNKTIYTLNLPSRIEGSYFLTDPISQENLLVVEADNGQWSIHPSSDVKLYKIDNTEIESVAVNYGDFYIVEIEGKKSIIYCDYRNDKSVKMYRVNGITNLKFGSQANCEITYSNPYFKEFHFEMTYTNNVWNINANKNAFVYINGGLNSKEARALKPGDMIYCYGLKIIVMKDIMFINNPGNTVKINTQGLKAIATKEKDVPYEEVKEEDLYKEEDYYFNTPRIRRFIDTYELSIANPPTKQEPQEMPFLLVIGPMLTTAITSVVTLGSTIIRLILKQITFVQSISALLMGFSMILATFLWPNLTKRWQKAQKEKADTLRKEKYLAYLEDKKKEILQETVNQSTILRENLLPLSEYYETIVNKRRTLWERKISQRDFLTIRVGIGDIPIDMNLQFTEEELVIEKDPLKEVAITMVDQAKMLHQVPIGYSFYNKIATAIMGKSELTKPFVDNMILQLIACHSYDELKIAIFTSENNRSDWEVYRDLPHIFNDDKSFRFFASNAEEGKNLSDYLVQEFAQRVANASEIVEKEGEENAPQPTQTYTPYYLIITDDYMKIRRYEICEYLLKTGAGFGFGFVFVDSRLSHLPGKCTNFITIDNPTSSILRTEVDDYYQCTFTHEVNETFDMETCVSKIANIPIEFSQDLRFLPTMLGFLELYGVGKVEQLNVLNRWKLNDPTQSLRAPLGLNDESNVIFLDLHEKYHGPHGLIAGTTGSGKSEFIITYILSMCVNYSPNEVAFILIDYKGGGLAGAFENKKNNVRLPHLAGTITNLDKNELNRTLVSIQSELTRRQGIFNEARDSLGESTIDIYKYQKFFREGKLDIPMPHLFIISDEFAELKAQQPEFMANLISAARIGRSLGVHLILATQKPAGVVNDQIWSNTKFRVCLKVAETSDSNEIIKRPDAAEIKNAGRFYLQVGTNEIFVLGQSAWCGTQYIPSDEIKKDYDRSLSFIDDSGQIIKSIADESTKKKASANGDELSNILKYVTTLADKEGLRVKNLWLDAIPEEIFMNDLIAKYNFKSDKPTAILGEYDDPTRQKQNILTLPLDTNSNTLVYGLTANTREMFLREVIYSASSLYPSDMINFYIFDFGSETFNIFTKFPHVGDVAFASETDKVGKLIKLIQDEISTRKKLFVDYNGDYDIYCRNSGNKLPIIMIIINNFESLRESYSTYEELLLILTREGRRYGVTFMVSTSSRAGLYSRFLKNFEHTFVLDMNTKEEYIDILGKIGNVIPAEKPGRGLFKKDIAYEYQTARFCSDDDLVEFIKEKAAELDAANEYKARKIPILPEIVTIESISTAPFILKEMPIAINAESLELVKYNFLADKATIVSGTDLETCGGFVYSLLTLFKQAGKIVTAVFDLAGDFEKAKDVAGAYAKDNMDAFADKILKFAEDKIINTEFYLTIFINGLEKLKETIPEEKLNSLLSLTNKHSNIRVIYFDGVYSMKKIIFEEFFQNYVINVNGIWVGSGFGDQTVIKTSNYMKAHSTKISSKFGWIVKSGNATMAKILDCEGKDEEQVSD